MRRIAVLALCLIALAGCPKPPAPVLGFPGPLAFQRWDTTFSGPAPITVFYPANSPGPHPIVIFVTGWNQTRGSYLGYGEELAQWGFIGILYAYPDPTLLGIGIDTFEQQVRHVSDIIDWCDAENVRSASPLFGQLDTAHVGVTGHSLGADIIVRATLDEPRIGAAVNLDAIIEDTRSADAVALNAQLAGIYTPILWIGTDKGFICSGPRGPNGRPLFDLANPPTEEVIVRGAAHIDFLEQSRGLNDLGQIICGGGTIDKNLARAIVSRYMISWFNVFLQEKTDSWTYLNGTVAQQDVADGAVLIRTKF